MVCAWLVIGEVTLHNPADSVRGPKHIVKKGKTLALSAELAQEPLNSIPVTERGDEMPLLIGLPVSGRLGVFDVEIAESY